MKNPHYLKAKTCSLRFWFYFQNVISPANYKTINRLWLRTFSNNSKTVFTTWVFMSRISSLLYYKEKNMNNISNSTFWCIIFQRYICAYVLGDEILGDCSLYSFYMYYFTIILFIYIILYELILLFEVWQNIHIFSCYYQYFIMRLHNSW